MGSGLPEPNRANSTGAGIVQTSVPDTITLHLQMLKDCFGEFRRYLDHAQCTKIGQDIASIEKSMAPSNLLHRRIVSATSHLFQIVKTAQRAVELRTQLNALYTSANDNFVTRLNAPDTSASNTFFHERRHDGTGEWFINGDTFQTWLETFRSFLWVHGIPGCGKSVLFSKVIHHIIENKRNTEIGLAYFDFDSKDASKQSASGMLRALLSELLMRKERLLLKGKSICAADIAQLYRSSDSPLHSLDDLLACLYQVVQWFPNTYILLDALDACPCDQERKIVLDAIAKMREWDLPVLHILVTSRDDENIHQALQTPKGLEIRMAQSNVDEDINTFLDHELEQNQDLQHWKDHRESIRTTLSKSAKGS